MHYLTLDFETYYDKAFSLSKVTTQEYIHDPRFEVLMVSLKWNTGDVFIIEGPQIKDYFATIDWNNTAIIAHNALFDASILHWHYGIKPAFIIDTMSMAQALGVSVMVGSVSLAACAKMLIAAGYDLPEKGTAVVNALGKRRVDFTPSQWAEYKDYCKTDTAITWLLFSVLRTYIPDDELLYQDMILRCFTEPMLKVHRATAEHELQRARAYRAEQLEELCAKYNTTQDNLAAVLRSNDKFAALLRALGGITQEEFAAGVQGRFIIPQKVSARTGAPTWAFGKTDVAFKELCDTALADVALVCSARIAAKSSIDETRAEKFISYAAFDGLPMGYRISGAHTGRLSGGSGGCLTADTAILCQTEAGHITEKPITDVLITDLVWDGVEWCEHDGVVFSGYKEVIEYDGIVGTTDHKVFTQENTTLSLAEAKETRTPIMDCPAPADWEHKTYRSGEEAQR